MDHDSPRLPPGLYWLHTDELSLVRYNFRVPAYVRADGRVHVQGWGHLDLRMQSASRADGIAHLARWIHENGDVPCWWGPDDLERRAAASARRAVEARARRGRN